MLLLPLKLVNSFKNATLSESSHASVLRSLMCYSFVLVAIWNFSRIEYNIKKAFFCC